MKFSAAAIGALAVTGASAAALQKRSSKSWAGSNNYFLQGLSSDAQDSYIQNLKDAGIKVARVWINQQSSGDCQKGSNLANDVPNFEDSIGQYNYDSLEAVHGVVVKLAAAGIKAIISPHDGNALGGDNPDCYGKQFGTGDFYTSQDAFGAYDNRLNEVLNYVSKASGKAFKDMGDSILAFDVENEPYQLNRDACSNNDQAGWLCGRAQTLRSTLGDGNSILVATGGIGGDFYNNCNLMQAALDCDAVDLLSIHRYAGSEADNNGEWANAIPDWLDKTNNANKPKRVYVEEWGFADNQGSEIPAQAADIDAGGIPWIYWQLLPQAQCSTAGDDQFGVFFGGDVDIAGIVSKTAGTDAKQDWSGLINF